MTYHDWRKGLSARQQLVIMEAVAREHGGDLRKFTRAQVAEMWEAKRVQRYGE